MSNLSHALARIIETHYRGNQRSLAAVAGVSESMISRYLSGDYRPTLQNLEKLCDNTSEEVCIAIARAHLQDECPRLAAHLLAHLAAEPAPLPLGLAEIVAKLDDQSRVALHFLAEQILLNSDARESVLCTVDYLRGIHHPSITLNETAVPPNVPGAVPVKYPRLRKPPQSSKNP